MSSILYCMEDCRCPLFCIVWRIVDVLLSVLYLGRSMSSIYNTEWRTSTILHTIQNGGHLQSSLQYRIEDIYNPPYNTEWRTSIQSSIQYRIEDIYNPPYNTEWRTSTCRCPLFCIVWRIVDVLYSVLYGGL
jgi:hypothetical protein